MRWSVYVIFVFLSVAASAAPQSATDGRVERLKAIQADPDALKAAQAAGRKASFFCANCHGENGVAKFPGVPNLAGQNPAYLLEQIRKFGSGERKDDFMQGMIKVLKEEEPAQIALFYAYSPVPPGRADAALAAQGKMVFMRTCIQCHGERARGNELIPRLAGQEPSYLQTALTRYRDRTGERNDVRMLALAANLKNEDIAAVVQYLVQMQ
jgi:cytochrome c553